MRPDFQNNQGQKITAKDHQILVDPELGISPEKNWFAASFWQQKNAVIGHSKGRYTTHFVRHDLANSKTLDMVLRHYYRGGLVGKVTLDKFFFSGFDSTRAFKEFTMLMQMRELNLPVPRPVAALVTKASLLFCRNDILIEKIENAKDGYQLLTLNPFNEQQWQNIGATIKQFHHQGVFHSDLNIHNIMMDDQDKIWLIDFDRCEFRKPDVTWQQANLARLKRSLNKELTLQRDFHFTERNWQHLLQGYNR